MQMTFQYTCSVISSGIDFKSNPPNIVCAYTLVRTIHTGHRHPNTQACTHTQACTPLTLTLTHIHTQTQTPLTRCVKSTEMLYSSKSTITLMIFYLSTSKITHLKIYSSKSKKIGRAHV